MAEPQIPPGPRFRCLDCGKTLNRDRQRAEARDEQED